MSTVVSEIKQNTNAASPVASRSRYLRNPALTGYALAFVVVCIGWIATRSGELVDPLNGVGYWLGIIGASLMATLLLYPVRKRVKWLRHLGATKHWFRMHMIFGVIGPILILYHCNFRLGSLNSSVALVCTLVVAVSGLVGRYLYIKIHTDLNGHRTSLQRLIEQARIQKDDQLRLTALVPQLLERVTELDAAVLATPKSMFASLLLPAKLAITTRIAQIKLTWYARHQIALQAKRSAVVNNERRRLQRSTARFIGRHLAGIRRVAELQSYERLFSLWHVFHLPFFYILVVTALVHVLAVHMY